MNATGHLARCSHRWKAYNVAKALTGMVKHELVDGLETSFDPVVEYDEAYEPFPWVVR